MNNTTKLLCLFLKAQNIDKSSDRGYSMLMVSMLSIVMFSLLLAATAFSNMTKSRTNAFVDSSSAFYVAEAGLNKRAAEINTILKSYSGVKGSLTSTGSVESTCLGVGIPAGGTGESTRSGNNDLECVNYRFQSSNNIAIVKEGANGNIALNSGGQNNNTYVAYTLVTHDTSNYEDGMPRYAKIPLTEAFGGLNAAEYKYVISAIGKKPVSLAEVSTIPVYTDAQIAAKNRQTTGAAAQAGDTALIAAYDSITNQANAASRNAAAAAKDSSNNTELSMTFTNRVIPLFQFAIFYNGDLELNSTSDMQINGWVHSNANMYLQPAGPTGVTPRATFMSNVSAVGSIYNRVDAWTDGVGRTGITRLLLTGTSNYQQLPDYTSGTTTPLTAPQISAFPNGQLKDDATLLKTPSPGFTRKRNYATNKVGEYFAKADMRLEMVPDRDITSKATSPAWTRNRGIIPFNFTAIRTGGTGTCTTVAPTAGSDPAANYIDIERENASTLRCNIFTKGQLQSLRQPVMVLTDINQNRSNGTTTTAQFRAQEGLMLGAPTLPTPPTIAADLATKTKVIRALQVTIASTRTPISLDILTKAFNDGSTYGTGDLATFKSTFETLINSIATLSASDRASLMTSSPEQIAALRGGWFLPAPIQRIERPNTDSNNTDAATNPRKSGFYDGREQRWITMLQTNIASLSVWNRDGLYVEADNQTLTTTYSTNTTNRNDAFASGAGANFTDGLAFDRVTTFTKTDGSEIYPTLSLQSLGLGSSDITEGGLVLHATVSDDLDGSGGELAAANDITVDTTDNTQRILKKKSDNTNELDSSGNPIVLDYYRKYPNQTASRQSPFGFAVNGGNYLPNSLMLVSDQSIYIQGNFNNNNNNDTTNLPPTTPNTPSPSRLPAAVVADTITVLSNQCVGGTNPLGVPLGQLTCGLPPQVDGAGQNYGNVTSAIAINAAFLSNTQVSNGNLGTGRYDGGTRTYSGGANNYIRLLENWYNEDGAGTPIPYSLNYSGSLISLSAPIEYGGLYRPGGVDPTDPVGTSYYNVPFRNFNYDTYFNNITKLPPLTPKTSYVRQNNFSRTY